MKGLVLTLLATVAALLLVGSIAPRASAATASVFVVNSAGDNSDTNPGNGVCHTSMGKCSLRAAIQEANAHPGADTIQFSIGSGGIKTIKPASPLPSITERVTIDGSTQPGCATYPCIVLDGENAGAFVDGLFIQAGHTIIKRLVINEFGGFGIHVRDASNNRIQGNFIGTDVHGTTARPNGVGVLVEVLTGNAHKNVIGGTTASTRNLISGNAKEAVAIQGFNASQNFVVGNYIGTDVSGAHALPNQSEGAVHIIEAKNNVVGGTSTGEGNVIAFNTNVGVRVCCDANTTGNAILENSIFSNGGLGIDLGVNGNITPNDALDGDTGPNAYQNFPVITSANSATQKIRGTLNSTPNTDITLELFSSPSCDGSGNGEGKQILGKEIIVHTNNTTGNASFTFSATTPFVTGAAITAIAHDFDGNTSEFSKCLTAS